MYLALEGIDGSGKTTQAQILLEYLRTQGESPQLCRYTSKHNPFGRLIHKITVPNESALRKHRSDHNLLSSLYARSGRMNYQSAAKGNPGFILGDRCALSVYASFQDRAPIKVFPEHPDHVIFIDISAENAMERLEKRGKALTDDENVERLRVLRGHYHSLMEHPPREFRNTQFICIDGDRPEYLVTESLKEVVEQGILQKIYKG